MASVQTTLPPANGWHPTGIKDEHQLSNFHEAGSLPTGFPLFVPWGLAQDASKLKLVNGSTVVYHLTAGDCDELDVALANFNGKLIQNFHQDERGV